MLLALLALVVRTEDQIKNILSKEKFEKLSIDERVVLHYMYNSGDNMTTRKATELTNKGTTFCRKMLKKLEEKNLLKWNGTSSNDRTQYYSLNF